MKLSELKRLINKHLIDSLPELTLHKNYLYKISNEYLLNGYCFDSHTSNLDDLRVYFFVQPLFLKSSLIFLSYSQMMYYKKKVNILKVKKEYGWDMRKESLDKTFEMLLISIKEQGEPFLNSISSVSDFYKYYYLERKDDLRTLEAIAYSSIFVENKSKQDDLLKKLISESSNDNTKWIKEINEDACLMLSLNNQEDRINLLNKYRDYTLEQLKLPR
jgi:hypothetical protein